MPERNDEQQTAPLPPLPRKERNETIPEWTREATSEFKRFEDLTKQLIKVPKSAIASRRKKRGAAES